MAFDVRVNGEHAKIVLSGDVDLQTTSDLKTEITKISGVTQLEIDASSVTYIDSSGVAVLLLARQHCQQNNVALSLPIISGAVSRVLEIAKLDRILPIGQVIDSTEDAGVMGLGASEAAAPADDDLVSELLAEAPAPTPTTSAAPVSSDSAEQSSTIEGGPAIKPGSFN